MGLRAIGACFILCVYFIGINGSTSQSRFIQTNRDLLLTAPQEVKIGDIFIWKFMSKNIVRFYGEKATTRSDYVERVVFFPHNLSLILQNVQLSDSGIYTAELLGENSEILATYNVTVEAPVSPVSLSVDSAWNSSDSCNFTVRCSSDRSSVSRSFTCDRHACEEPRPLTPDPAPSLHLYLSNLSIICNHSNHVSWTQDAKRIQDVCPLFDPNYPPDRLEIGGVIGGVIAAVLFVLGALAIYRWRRQKSQRIEVDNTVYDTPLVQPNRPVTESPNTIYSEVQPHTGPVPAPAQNIESLYSTVNKSSTPDLLSSA